MTYEGSYLWQLRQRIGNDLVLMPGAMVALLDEADRVLMTARQDDGTWCLPAGAAEAGGSFARTAIDELAEETGLAVGESDLIAFGCLSNAEDHTIRYPNGDITHCFAVLFLARKWHGQLRPDSSEVTNTQFVGLDSPPSPLHGPTSHALDLLRAYLQSSLFQIH
jgi:8-oxo-dGTP pyrophosphatase MutT (NUDIX family)